MDIKMSLLNFIKLSASTKEFEKIIKAKGALSPDDENTKQILNEGMKVACQYAEGKWIAYLHEKGAKISTEELKILFKSTALNDPGIVNYAVEFATDIDYEVGVYAIKHTKYANIVIKELIEKSIDITANDNELLIRACESKCSNKVLEMLLKAGADPTARNNEAIKLAAKNGRRDIIDTLIKVGVDVTANNNAAIKEAYNSSQLGMIRYLYSKGARFENLDISRKANMFLNKFIYETIIENDIDMLIIEELIKAGAYIRVIDYIPACRSFYKKLMKDPLCKDIAKKVFKTMRIR